MSALEFERNTISDDMIYRYLSTYKFNILIAGQTDEVKGTGVFSAFELKRDKEEDKKEGEDDDDNK